MMNARLPTVVGLLVACHLVIIDLVRPGPVDLGPVHLAVPIPDRGVMSAAGVVLLVLLARVTFLSLPGLVGVTLVLVLVVGGITAATDVPAVVIRGDGFDLVPWLRTLAFACLVGLVDKVMLLRRLCDLSLSNDPSDDVELVPTQQNDLELIADLVEAGWGQPGWVVQVTGEWGVGKSTILRKLSSELSSRSTATRGFAVVNLSVWKYESDSDLHRALVENILASPTHTARLAWLRYPSLMSLAPLVREIKAGISTTVVKADTAFHVPRLLWQRPLERVVRHGRVHRGISTVVVMDEADRASPPVVQALLTIVRRSLESAGVSVVLSYVPTAMRFKAFNLMLDGLPDLEATNQAVVFETLYEGADTPLGAAMALRVVRPPTEEGQFQGPDLLRRAFASMDRRVRQDVQNEMSEKYLDHVPFRLASFDGNDVATMITGWSVSKVVLDPICAQHHIDAERLRAGLSAYLGGVEMPPVRLMQASVLRVLRAYGQSTKALGALVTEEDLVLVLGVAVKLTRASAS